MLASRSGFSPSTFRPQPALWVKADSFNPTHNHLDPITAWPEMMGKLTQLNQPQSDRRPYLLKNVLNNHSALYFDGAGFLIGPYLNLVAPWVVFVVYKESIPSASSRFIDFTVNGSGNLGIPWAVFNSAALQWHGLSVYPDEARWVADLPPSDTWKILAAKYDGLNSYIRINGVSRVLAGNPSHTNPMLGQISVGGGYYGHECTSALIAEIGYVSGNPNPAPFEKYLSREYGITLP